MSLSRLLALYQHARPSEREQGFFWYDTAGLEIHRLVQSYNFPYHVVAGVLAVLSPGTSWEQSLRDTETVLSAVAFNKKLLASASEMLLSDDSTPVASSTCEAAAWGALDEITVTSYGANRDKAISIAATHRVFPYLSGSKVEAFYHNLCGDYSELALDTHAVNAFYGRRIGSNLDSRYRAWHRVHRAYTRAAALRGMEPARFQAIIWLVHKRRIEERRVEGYEK